MFYVKWARFENESNFSDRAKRVFIIEWIYSILFILIMNVFCIDIARSDSIQSRAY